MPDDTPLSWKIAWTSFASNGCIRDARRAKGLTHRDVEKALGLHKHECRSIENFTLRPSNELRDQLAEFLEIHPQQVWPESLKPVLQKTLFFAGHTSELVEFDLTNDLKRRTRNTSVPAKLFSDLTQGEFDSLKDIPVTEDERAEVEEFVGEALRRLPLQLRRVITMRYGLGGATPMKLREIGRSLGVTKERARQILMVAMLRITVPIRNHPADADGPSFGRSIRCGKCGRKPKFTRRCHVCRIAMCGRCASRINKEGRYFYGCPKHATASE